MTGLQWEIKGWIERDGLGRGEVEEVGSIAGQRDSRISVGSQQDLSRAAQHQDRWTLAAASAAPI